MKREREKRARNLRAAIEAPLKDDDSWRIADNLAEG